MNKKIIKFFWYSFNLIIFIIIPLLNVYNNMKGNFYAYIFIILLLGFIFVNIISYIIGENMHTLRFGNLPNTKDNKDTRLAYFVISFLIYILLFYLVVINEEYIG